MAYFLRDDLSNYNTAGSPWYRVELNGKVDIGVKIGEEPKIGLSTTGMITLIEAWLKEGNIRKQGKDEIRSLLD